jgi:hypothetical protein
MKLTSLILMRKSSNDCFIIINSSIEVRMKWFLRIDSEVSFRTAHATLRIILFLNKIKMTSDIKFRKIIKRSFFAFVIIRLIDSYRAKTNEWHTNLIKPNLLTRLIGSSNGFILLGISSIGSKYSCHITASRSSWISSSIVFFPIQSNVQVFWT